MSTPEAHAALETAIAEGWAAQTGDTGSWWDDAGQPMPDVIAAAILAAMPDWVLMPRVATADWTGSTKAAGRMGRLPEDDAECDRLGCEDKTHLVWHRRPTDAVPDAECEVTVTLVGGVEGPSIYLNDYRIVGPKPWGGGTIQNQWKGRARAVLTALNQPSDALAAPTEEER